MNTKKIVLRVAEPILPTQKYVLTSTQTKLEPWPWIRATMFGIYCIKCCGQARFGLNTDTDERIDSFVLVHSKCKTEWERQFPLHQY